MKNKRAVALALHIARQKRAEGGSAEHDPFNIGAEEATPGWTDRLRKGVLGSMVGGMRDLAMEPGRQAMPNPYPGGSEEAGYHDMIAANRRHNWGPEVATNMIGMGGPGALARPGTAGIVGGRLAKTADLKSLERAEEMWGNKYDRHKALMETGWYKKGVGEPGFEISDHKSVAVPTYARGDSVLGARMYHPDLFEAYPSLRDMPVKEQGVIPGAYYDNFSKHIHLPPELSALTGPPRGAGRSANAGATFLHEINHAIQDIEGTLKIPGQGDYPRRVWKAAEMIAPNAPNEVKLKIADVLYERVPIEAESRAVEKRAKMTPDARKHFPIWLDEVSPEKYFLVGNTKSTDDLYEKYRTFSKIDPREVPLDDFVRGVRAESGGAKTNIEDMMDMMRRIREMEGRSMGGNIDKTARKYAAGGELPWQARHASSRLQSGMLKSTVPGRTDKLPIDVNSGSYVIPADIVSGLGQGNSDAGGNILSQMFNNMGKRAGKTGSSSRLHRGKVPKAGKINFAGGGPVEEPVPIIAAGGEFVLDPEIVLEIGGGDMDRGHAILDAFVKHARKEVIKTLKKLPGPAKD